MRFVLIHSPVLGPSSWRWVGDALRRRRHEVAVPDLRAAASGGSPDEFVDAAVGAAGGEEPAIIVGHSGAGAMLPMIAARRSSRTRLVFVDAGIPPCDGTFLVGGAFLERLHELAVDGVLPPWPRWWPPGVMEGLVADAARRRQVEADLPQVPVEFYDTRVQVPAGWCRGAAAYVLLSEAYRDDADRARSLGWPVVEHLGNHLGIVDQAEGVAEIVVAVADD